MWTCPCRAETATPGFGGALASQILKIRSMQSLAQHSTRACVWLCAREASGTMVMCREQQFHSISHTCACGLVGGSVQCNNVHRSNRGKSWDSVCFPHGRQWVWWTGARPLAHIFFHPPDPDFYFGGCSVTSTQRPAGAGSAQGSVSSQAAADARPSDTASLL